MHILTHETKTVFQTLLLTLLQLSLFWDYGGQLKEGRWRVKNWRRVEGQLKEGLKDSFIFHGFVNSYIMRLLYMWVLTKCNTLVHCTLDGILFYLIALFTSYTSVTNLYQSIYNYRLLRASLSVNLLINIQFRIVSLFIHWKNIRKNSTFSKHHDMINYNAEQWEWKLTIVTIQCVTEIGTASKHVGKLAHSKTKLIKLRYQM